MSTPDERLRVATLYQGPILVESLYRRCAECWLLTPGPPTEIICDLCACLKMTNPNTWMADNYGLLQDLPFPCIMLPGTHDSGAYAFSSRCLSPKARDKYLSWLATVAKPFLKPWTCAQVLTVQQQLEAGIRFLDIRVSACLASPGCFGQQKVYPKLGANEQEGFTGESCSFWVSHTFACVPLDDVLAQIRSFLDSTSHEVVVLRMESDWEHRTDMLEPARASLLCELLADRLGGYVYDHGNLKPGQWPTLGDAVSIPQLAYRSWHG